MGKDVWRSSVYTRSTTMFRLLPLLLVACVSEPPDVGNRRPRLVWSSTADLLAVIQTLEHGTSTQAPWAAYIASPADLPSADFDRIHEALRARGSEAPHSEPSLLDPTTSDPGRALITGKWADIGRFKVPALRGLVNRPPYFHNGLASNLDEVLEFYQRRFDIDLSREEQRDLIAFRSAL